MSKIALNFQCLLIFPLSRFFHDRKYINIYIYRIININFYANLTLLKMHAKNLIFFIISRNHV
jgi:hypothetical protein